MRCPARPAARFVYFVWSPDLHHRFEAAVAELGLVAIAQIMDDHGPARRERSHSPEHQVAPPKVQALLMQKRVDTECKTADQSRHQEQGSAAAQTRCRAGEQLMEMLHASSPASTPTGVPHQGGEYHIKGGSTTARCRRRRKRSRRRRMWRRRWQRLHCLRAPSNLAWLRAQARRRRRGCSAAPGWAVGMGSHPWSTSRN